MEVAQASPEVVVIEMEMTQIEVGVAVEVAEVAAMVVVEVAVEAAVEAAEVVAEATEVMIAIHEVEKIVDMAAVVVVAEAAETTVVEVTLEEKMIQTVVAIEATVVITAGEAVVAELLPDGTKMLLSTMMTTLENPKTCMLRTHTITMILLKVVAHSIQGILTPCQQLLLTMMTKVDSTKNLDLKSPSQFSTWPT